MGHGRILAGPGGRARAHRLGRDRPSGPSRRCRPPDWRRGLDGM